MMSKSLASVADSRRADDRCLSRAERLEIISQVAPVGMSEAPPGSSQCWSAASLTRIREWRK